MEGAKRKRSSKAAAYKQRLIESLGERAQKAQHGDEKIVAEALKNLIIHACVIRFSRDSLFREALDYVFGEVQEFTTGGEDIIFLFARDHGRGLGPRNR